MIAQTEIKFNTFYGRWEVFSNKSVIRNGELQPVFVSQSKRECELYVAWTE